MKYQVELVVCEKDMTWHYERYTVELDDVWNERVGEFDFENEVKGKAIDQRPATPTAFIGLSFYDEAE